MLTASPITNQPVGKTFNVAISVLGVGALLLVFFILWGVWHRPFPMAPMANDSASVPIAVAKATMPNPSAGAQVGNLTLNTNPFSEPSSVEVTPATSTTPPKPTPVSTKPQEAQPANHFEEVIFQGKELRERGDMNAAITKFREAGTMDAKSAVPLAELAKTYEKMGLADKAAENWRRVYDTAEKGDVYYALAEAKLQASHETALRSVATQGAAGAAAAPEDTSNLPAVNGVPAGAILGLLQVTSEDVRDDNSAKRFTLHIPIQARPKVRIDVRDLVIHVLFYDVVDEKNVVQTSANVNSKWATPPADWVDSDTEELAVEYQLPKPEARSAKRENRKYFGYIVRIYYKGRLQSANAEPERLAQQYPAPPTLPKESDK